MALKESKPKIMLLDAGFSLQLQQHVKEVVDGHPLWTARFLLDDPKAVEMVHRDFIRAGSMIIRANTYQASVDGFTKHMGLTKEKALDLIGFAVEIAKQSVIAENKDVLIAGSVGPYGASLNDGSEYTGSYTDQVTVDQLVSWHEDRFSKLVSCNVDLLALETIPCSKEAVAMLKLLKKHPKVKAWISFSIKDEESISNGEKFVDAIDIVLKEAAAYGVSDRIIAIGMNCLKPKLVTPLLTKAKASFPTQDFIVYPNSGEHYNTQLQRWEPVEGMIHVSEYLKTWLELGVRYVGGCCRTVDKDLEAMLVSVQEWSRSHCS